MVPGRIVNPQRGVTDYENSAIRGGQAVAVGIETDGQLA